MGRPGPHQSPERIAQVLVDAIALGDVEACKRWGISTRSLARYRAAARNDGPLAELVRRKLSDVSQAWLEKTSTARNAILDKVLELVAKAKGRDLRYVVSALEKVQDAHLSERVVRDELGGQGEGSADDRSPVEAAARVAASEAGLRAAAAGPPAGTEPH